MYKSSSLAYFMFPFSILKSVAKTLSLPGFRSDGTYAAHESKNVYRQGLNV